MSRNKDLIGEVLGIKGLPNIPLPPSPSKLKEVLQGVVEEISEVKEAPRVLLERVKEAEEDFRQADKAFRKVRPRTRRG